MRHVRARCAFFTRTPTGRGAGAKRARIVDGRVTTSRRGAKPLTAVEHADKFYNGKKLAARKADADMQVKRDACKKAEENPLVKVLFDGIKSIPTISPVGLAPKDGLARLNMLSDGLLVSLARAASAPFTRARLTRTPSPQAWAKFKKSQIDADEAKKATVAAKAALDAAVAAEEAAKPAAGASLEQW